MIIIKSIQNDIHHHCIVLLTPVILRHFVFTIQHSLLYPVLCTRSQTNLLTFQQMLNKPKSIGKWKIEGKLGEGAFGYVYLVSVALRGSQRHGYAAMKVEERKASKFDELLRMEVYVLQKLQVPNGQHQKFFCTIHDQGQTDNFNYLVITLLGKPLEDLRRMQTARKFSEVTTLKIGIQLMAAFKRMHKAGFIHRDVKPANMAPGHKRPQMIYLFDFGLARFIYKDESKKELREPRARANFRGTHRYCSFNAQKNNDQGRVDDLWGVLYCLIEFCTGRLPWAGIPTKDKERMKEKIADAELFQHCPPSFQKISQRLRSLGFADEPDYVQYERWMNDDLEGRGVNLHGNGAMVPFEWEQRSERTVGQKSSEELLANALREKGPNDDDSIRTADSIFSTSASRNTSHTSDGEGETIDDTLDEIPENHELMKKFQTDKEKRNKAANGGTRPADGKKDENSSKGRAKK